MMVPPVLDKRVALQIKDGAVDALNTPTGAWVNFLPGDGRVWARITDITGRQFVSAGGTQNAVQTEILIRRRAGVVASMRAVYAGMAYDIQAVLERERDWLSLMCTKGVSDG